MSLWVPTWPGPSRNQLVSAPHCDSEVGFEVSDLWRIATMAVMDMGTQRMNDLYRGTFSKHIRAERNSYFAFGIFLYVGLHMYSTFSPLTPPSPLTPLSPPLTPSPLPSSLPLPPPFSLPQSHEYMKTNQGIDGYIHPPITPVDPTSVTN